MACKCCTYGVWSIITLVVGLLAAGIGIGGSFFVEYKLHKGIIQQAIVDSPDSPGYGDWQNNTSNGKAPEWQNFYIWNVTNPNDVENGSIPNVTQIGPYSFRQYNTYFDVSFNSDGTEISWREWTYYVWDQQTSFSNADPYNDVVTVINVPYQAVLGSLQWNSDKDNHWWETAVFSTLASATNSTLFVKKHPIDLIFGYEDPLLQKIALLQPGTQTTFGLQVNESFEEAMQQEKMNTAYTGKDNITNIFNYKMWNNQTSLTCWANPWANRIVGNDATQFWPGISMTDQPWVWSSDLYRGIYLEANSTIEVKGITLLNFKLPPSGLLNATSFPQNAGFYQFGYNGVENASSPLAGVPIYISKPNFLDADPWFYDNINGLAPDKTKHDLNINVEPNIGATLSAQKRLQINLKLTPDFLYPGVREEIYVPLAWIEQVGELTDAQASQFKGSVYLAQTITQVMRWSGVGLGGVLLLTSLTLAVRRYKQKKREDDLEYKPLIN